MRTTKIDKTEHDHRLETLSAIYINNKLKDRGITLEQFLANPDYIISAAFFGTAMPLPEDCEYYPLLEDQLEVQRRLDREAELEMIGEEEEHELYHHLPRDIIIENRNGCFIQPMHHRDYPCAGKVQFKR